MIRRRFTAVLSAALLLGAFPVFAQPVSGSDCPPGTFGSLGIDTTDVCKARVLGMQARLEELGGRLCSDGSSDATAALEARVVREFGDIVRDCGDAILTAESELTQHYLHSWLNGPSEGYGEDLKVHGVKLTESLRQYRNNVTGSTYGTLDASKLPGWYKNQAAYAQAVAALVSSAREMLSSGSSWSLDNISRTFQSNTGLTDDDARVKFIKDMASAIAEKKAAPAELLAEYAKNPPIRLNGPNGFYTQYCDAKAASDDSLADGLSLAWATHLLAYGPGQLEALQSTIDAVKPGFNDWQRAEPAFGSEMTGAYMSKYVKDTYFANDDKIAPASAAMARALANEVNAPVRAALGLPKIVSTEQAGDTIGMAGTRFDSNDNLRVVFPGKCELDSVRHVKADGSTGEILKDTDWDARGVYDVDSFGNNKDFPISELVLREESRTNKDKARAYDVTLKCEGTTRKFRLQLPPRPDTTEPIDFITSDKAPPYKDMLADGKLNGLMVAGHHTRDAHVMVDALEALGFREVSRNEDVSIRDQFYSRLEEKDARTGKPALDYFVKDAHANGYAFDAGMFRANKRGVEVVMEKRGPDGKPHRIVVLGNKDGEGEESKDGFETVDYAKFFEVMGKRGDHHLFVGNFSCWSDGKSAFEMDGIRNKKVKYMPTDVMSTFWLGYWNGLEDEEIGFALVKALDKKKDYAWMREQSERFDEEILMPDDPTFVEKMTDKIKSHRASSTGIPVTVSLEETRPSS